MSYQICTKCVMDTTDPDITFNEEGACKYCLEYPAKEKARKTEAMNRPWIYNAMKQGKQYDCLIGLSGGVDSSLALHYLIENGVKPLVFTIDNGWNTQPSEENIMKMVETLKVPFYRYTIDVEKFKELQRTFLKASVANAEIPTDHILMASTYEMARDNGIKWIVSGGNLSTEGIMPPAWGYNARDLTHIKGIYKEFTGKKLEGLPTISLLQYLYNRFIKGIKIVNLLDYYIYDREEAKKILAEKYGWIDYGDKHCENMYTMWFQNFYLPRRFGFDKRKPHYSSMIHSGQMSREQAMERLLEAPEYPQVWPAFLIGVMKSPRKTYRDYPNSEFWWNLLSKIYGIIKVR